MAQCKYCHAELQEEQGTCPACGAGQVETDQEPFLAISVAGEMEANRIAAALKDSGIPITREYEDLAASVVTGNSPESMIQLYVPQDMADKAADVLIGIGALEPGEEAPGQEAVELEAPSKGSRMKSALMTVLVLLLVALVVFSADAIMAVIKQLFGLR